MIISTHARIAKRTTKSYFSYYKRTLIILGAVIPDFNWFSLPHRGHNLGDLIAHNEYKIRHTTSVFVKYIRLGNMLHYLCDYFCYAHKDDMDISHGTCHTKYEMKIGRLFRLKLYQKLKNMPPDDRQELWTHFKAMQKEYAKKPGTADRDLKYALSAVEYCIENMLSSEAFCQDEVKFQNRTPEKVSC